MNIQNASTGPSSSSGAVSKVTVGELRSWLKQAQPGARLLYFSGYFAGDGSEALNEALRIEADRGMVFLVQQKRARWIGGSDYLAVRSSRPIEGDAKPSRTPGLREQIDSAFGRRR